MTWEAKPGRWHSVVDGEVIYRGKSPHFGAARALIKAGYDPETKIVTKTRKGTAIFNLTLAMLAGLMVKEKKSGKTPPYLAPYAAIPKMSQYRRPGKGILAKEDGQPSPDADTDDNEDEIADHIPVPSV